jgi:class 3 adenylate cyclase
MPSSFLSLAVFAVTRHFAAYRTIQLSLMLVLPFVLQLELGGFQLGSAVLIWSFFAPIGALLVADRPLASWLLATFVLLVVLAVLLQPLLRTSNNLPDGMVALFLVLNLGCTAAVTFAAMLYFVRHVTVAFALELRRYAAELAVGEVPAGLPLRIGIASGPAVAGVIGRTKFQYDLWGDTVNMASRMESHGVPGRIQVTEATYLLVRDTFECVPCGEIDIKGKGRLPTWFVEGELRANGCRGAS